MSDIQVSLQKCKEQLAPVLEMLNYKKSILNPADWKNFVKETEHSIVNHPHQYLSKFPRKDRSSLNLVLEEIFEELIKD